LGEDAVIIIITTAQSVDEMHHMSTPFVHVCFVFKASIQLTGPTQRRHISSTPARHGSCLSFGGRGTARPGLAASSDAVPRRRVPAGIGRVQSDDQGSGRRSQWWWSRWQRRKRSRQGTVIVVVVAKEERRGHEAKTKR